MNLTQIIKHLSRIDPTEKVDVKEFDNSELNAALGPRFNRHALWCHVNAGELLEIARGLSE